MKNKKSQFNIRQNTLGTWDKIFQENDDKKFIPGKHQNFAEFEVVLAEIGRDLKLKVY